MIADEVWAAILADCRRRGFGLVIPHEPRAQPRLVPRVMLRLGEPRWRKLIALRGSEYVERIMRTGEWPTRNPLGAST